MEPHALRQRQSSKSIMSSPNLTTSTTATSRESEPSGVGSSAQSTVGKRSLSAWKSPGKWVRKTVSRRSSRQDMQSSEPGDKDKQTAEEAARAKPKGFLRIFGLSSEARHGERQEADTTRRHVRRARLDEYRTFERADYWMCYCII